MKLVIRYQSQLIPRRSYKVGRRVSVTFRPSRAAAPPLCRAAPLLPGTGEIPVSELNRALSGAALDKTDSAGWCSQSAHLPETQKVSAQF